MVGQTWYYTPGFAVILIWELFRSDWLLEHRRPELPYYDDTA